MITLSTIQLFKKDVKLADGDFQMRGVVVENMESLFSFLAWILTKRKVFTYNICNYYYLKTIY